MFFRHIAALLIFASACTGGGDQRVPEDPCDEPGTICRVAGWGAKLNGFNGEDLLATQSMLYYPSALSETPDGRLVIVDFNNMRIRALEADGTLADIAGVGFHAYAQEGPALDSPLENPIDVAFDADGSFYIAELHAARVLHVDTSGELTIVAGTGDPGYTGDGGPGVEAMLSESAGVAVLPDGTVVIADTDNQCLRSLSPDGVITTLAGAGQHGFDLDDPERVRVAPDGSLLVADTGNHAIRRFDPATGDHSVIAGGHGEGYSGDGGPAADAALHSPTAAFEDADGAIWIADGGNHVIRRVDPDGTIETFAGTGEPGFTGDGGPALEATFDLPADVRIGADGAVYVADLLNGAVRRIAR
jgi:sugar lactone lactonase YvrE